MEAIPIHKQLCKVAQGRALLATKACCIAQCCVSVGPEKPPNASKIQTKLCASTDQLFLHTWGSMPIHPFLHHPMPPKASLSPQPRVLVARGCMHHALLMGVC